MPLRYGLIEPADLGLPRLPRTLQGLRLAHVSDTHITRARPRLESLLNQLPALRLDLLLLTGDFMTAPGDEDATMSFLQRLTDRVKPSVGTFGVFGNHDSAELIDRCQSQLRSVHWLINTAKRAYHRDTPIDVLGFHTQRGRGPDSVALAQAGRARLDPEGNPQPLAPPADPDRPLRIALSHFPFSLPPASDLGADLLLSGHTHGGQIRLPGGIPLRNACPLPLNLTTGLQRHRNTLGVVSRGLGEMTLPFRAFCPPHAPVYTLRQKSLPGQPTDQTVRLWHW